MVGRKENLQILIDKYKSFKVEGRLDLSSEETIRTWINELLHIFEWDVMDTSEILQEKRLSRDERERLNEIGSTSTRPDYTFKIGNQKLTFLDTKGISVNIETSSASAFQIKSYGWSILAPCSFLTNFEEFAIYDCTYIPRQEQLASLGRIYLKMDEYVDNFELLEKHLLKSNVLSGVLSKIYSDTLRNDRSIQKLTPDFVFAQQLSEFRLALAKDIVRNNANLICENSDLLAYLTQVIINRIIFIRICEARKIEKDGLLLDFLNNGFWDSFKSSSYTVFYEHYDGPLFERIRDIHELEVSDEVFNGLIGLLYYPSPYRFDVIPTKLLSDIYEIFLSKKLIIEDGEVSEKLKLEYIKTNGAISTPQYLVCDILKRTLNIDSLVENGLDSVFDKKILDIACGSGTFLIETFDYLQDIIINYYIQHPNSNYSNLFFHSNDFVGLNIEGKRHLITQCIFGVDIDPEAVEVTRMSLSLKVIDSSEYYENYQGLGIFGNQILNNIGCNIKCGNSLVPTDIIQLFPEITRNQEQLFKTNAFDYNGNNGFPDVFEMKGGFDFIVGNPPYVEVKNYNIDYPYMHEYIKANYSTTRNGKIDLAVAFIERSISILNATGKLGFIIQRRFFKTDYGQAIREFISSQNLLSQVIEFESSNIFSNRVTYIATLILNKSEHENIAYLNIANESEEIPSVLRSIKPFEEDSSNFMIIPLNGVTRNPWNFEDAELLSVKTNLLNEYGTFGDFAKLRVGIQVLWDHAYHIRVESMNERTITGSTHLEDSITIERDACRPLMVNENFYPFCKDETTTFVIFPYDTSILTNSPILFSYFCERFPLAGNYLLRNKARILESVQTVDNEEQWHLFTRVQNHKAVYPKILIPMTANDTYATVTQNPINYCDNANMFFVDIPEKTEVNLFAIAGIINSTLFSVIARSIALSQQNGYFKFNKQFIEPIPFPKENFNNNRLLVSQISRISQTIKQKQEQFFISSPRQKNVLRTILIGLWRDLDLKVYELYNLSVDQVHFFDQKGRNINRVQLLN